MQAIDWSKCPDTESVPDRVSGQWTVVGTRILADGVIGNAEAGVSLEELASDIFPGLDLERARRIVACATRHAAHSA